MRFKTPTFILKIHRFLDGLHIPILGISLWKMFEIYGEGIFKNKILRQAAAISWSFFNHLFASLSCFLLFARNFKFLYFIAFCFIVYRLVVVAGFLRGVD
jgi:hypothetical protein